MAGKGLATAALERHKRQGCRYRTYEGNRVMEEEHKSIWRQPAGMFLLWPVPALLAALGHLYAWPKAYMRGTGPGLDIALMNERTARAQRLWHMVDAWPAVLVLYGVLLVGAALLMRKWHQRLWVSAVTWIVLAIPGLWYFLKIAYLGGKVLILYQ